MIIVSIQSAAIVTPINLLPMLFFRLAFLKHLFFYKNTLYKNIEAQILDLEILKWDFSESIYARFKLIIKTNLGYPKKYFKHIIEGGS